VARFLYSNLQGLLLLAKATRDRKLLSDVVKVTLSVLDLSFVGRSGMYVPETE
jgi:hypothetical protein